MNNLSPRSYAAIIVVIGVIVLGSGPPLIAQNTAEFSNASLSGTYVFRASGSSLFTLPNDLTSAPVYLASIGVIWFDGQGLLRGSVSNSATRTELVPAGKYITPYSSQIFCNAKMTGTYSVDPDGTATMTISFTPTNHAATCGASTGVFNLALVSPTQVEFVSSGQMMADPSKGEFNSYVVQGELLRRSGGDHAAKRR